MASGAIKRDRGVNVLGQVIKPKALSRHLGDKLLAFVKDDRLGEIVGYDKKDVLCGAKKPGRRKKACSWPECKCMPPAMAILTENTVGKVKARTADIDREINAAWRVYLDEQRIPAKMVSLRKMLRRAFAAGYRKGLR